MSKDIILAINNIKFIIFIFTWQDYWELVVLLSYFIFTPHL